MKKLILLLLGLTLAAPASTFAQTDAKVKVKDNKVKIKPKEPKFTRAASPGKDYTYVREDWTWNPTTMTWDWNGNRWVQATEPKQQWMPGRWIKNTDDTWSRVEGYWKK